MWTKLISIATTADEMLEWRDANWVAQSSRCEQRKRPAAKSERNNWRLDRCTLHVVTASETDWSLSYRPDAAESCVLRDSLRYVPSSHNMLLLYGRPFSIRQIYSRGLLLIFFLSSKNLNFSLEFKPQKRANSDSHCYYFMMPILFWSSI